MRAIRGSHAKVINALVAAIGIVALVALGIFVGIHVFLAAVGHYAPWEQIWAG